MKGNLHEEVRSLLDGQIKAAAGTVVGAKNQHHILVALHNHSDLEQTIEPAERVAQLVITPFITADFNLTDSLSETVRGEGGFGSTGTK